MKDYGLILSINDEYTGFVVNEQRASGKSYKPGQVLKTVVLDIDRDKHMLDLSERLAEVAPSSKAIKDAAKVCVELTKENYMIVCFKQDRSKFAVCLLQDSVNSHAVSSKYEAHSIGDELEVRVVKQSGDLALTLPKITVAPSSGLGKQSLTEGEAVQGILKSVKGLCAYVQVGMDGRVPQIARLHKIETEGNDFEQTKVGDRISCKVLRVSEGKSGLTNAVE